jgi:Zn-finger nucleic acid-binding protein
MRGGTRMTKASEDHVRGNRTCPRCMEEMWIVERKGQKLDTCIRCRGIWFDVSELDSVLGGEGRVELLAGIKPSIRGEKLECPACRGYMEPKDIFGVFVDICPDCGGIWMDAGETEKIWVISHKVMDPFLGNAEDMDPATFWYPFKKNQEMFSGR